VLVPWLLEGPRRAAELVMSADRAFDLVYSAFFLVAITGGLLAVVHLLRLWHPTNTALAVALLVAAVMPLAFHRHVYQPWSMLDLPIAALALRWVYLRRPTTWLVGLTVLATLNRETGMFVGVVVLAGAAAQLGIRNAWRASLPLIAGAATYLSLRALLGSGPPVETVSSVWSANRSDLAASGLYVGLLVSGFVVLGVMGRKRVERFFSWQLVAAVIYLAFVGVFGVWAEVRLLLALLPLGAVFTAAALQEDDVDGKTRNRRECNPASPAAEPNPPAPSTQRP
jgi:hypothetical protein